MTAEPSIRPAGIDDAEAMGAVHARSSRAAFSSLVPAPVLARIASLEGRQRLWTERLGAPPLGSCTLVAEVAGRVVGLVGVGPSRDQDRDAETVGEVGVLYVDPACWGRGIGRALHDHGIESLRAAGFRSATLWTLATGARTHSFYERQGWRLDGEERPLSHAPALIEVRYARVLDDQRETL